MNNRYGWVIAILSVFVIAVSSFAYLLLRPAPVYETNDISDYGIIKGNYDNESPKEFVSSFFPEKIEDTFSDVTYHYKAQKLDTYAYEMYLDFVIKDKEIFNSFLSGVIGDNSCEPFYFDPTFRAYYISNYLTLDEGIGEEKALYLNNAKVGLILYSEEKQCFIFTALGVYDGGGTLVDDLSFFFRRFGIDPQEYEKQATPGIS